MFSQLKVLKNVYLSESLNLQDFSVHKNLAGPKNSSLKSLTKIQASLFAYQNIVFGNRHLHQVCRQRCLIVLLLFIFNVSFSSICCAILDMGRCCIGIRKASYFVDYCNQLQVMARRSDRLRSRDPEIVEMEFECFFVSWKVLHVKRTFYA